MCHIAPWYDTLGWFQLSTCNSNSIHSRGCDRLYILCIVYRLYILIYPLRQQSGQGEPYSRYSTEASKLSLDVPRQQPRAPLIAGHAMFRKGDARCYYRTTAVIALAVLRRIDLPDQVDSSLDMPQAVGRGRGRNFTLEAAHAAIKLHHNGGTYDTIRDRPQRWLTRD